MYKADPKPLPSGTFNRHYHRKNHTVSADWDEWNGTSSRKKRKSLFAKALPMIGILGALCALVTLMIYQLS
jgi:hypothetical protein